MSAGQFSRRTFLKTTGAATAGAIVATSLPTPVGAASADSADAVGFSSDGNPFITNIYTADPDAFVFNGRLYVDTDRDQAPLGANDFVMTDWHLYSTTDTVNWTDHGVLLSLADFPWANRNAWAPQMVPHDGKFFWYLPMQKAATNSMSIGVAVGDSPTGPFHDAIGGPLIDNNTPNHSSFDIDPTVLVDDDGQAYIYWGSFSSPRAAKLKPNMIELEVLQAGGGGAAGPRVPGELGNAIALNGSTEYVSLPAGIVSTLSDYTVSAWVNPAATNTWARIFDFGTSTGNYMFLAASAGAAPRFAITSSGNGSEQQLNGTAPLPVNQWTHVAVTLSGTTGTLYVNGTPVSTNPNMTLHPSSLGNTTNNWLGRSQFADPFLRATLDDVQIYSRALSAAEVEALAGGQPGAGDVASYRFDEDGGATAVDSSGNGHDATIVSPPVVAITPQGLTGYWEAPYLFKRNGTYYLAYARGNPRTGGNPASIDYATASNPLGPWTYRGRILDTVTNTTTNHSAIIEFNGQWYIVYHNGMLPLGGEFRRSVCIDKLNFNADGTIQLVTQTLSAEARKPKVWYRFDESGGTLAADSSGNDLSATLVNGASHVPGVLGNGVRLSGASQYVSLPTGILWNMYDFTVATWVKLDTTDGVPHVFDFGTGTNVYMYLTPRSSTGTARFAITTGGPTREQAVNGTSALPTGRWTHVAVMKSALVVTLYVNGVQVGQNLNVGLYPARLGNAPNNWFGRSQDAADPYLTGAIDDVHIHQRALNPTELASLILVGLINSLKGYITGLPIPAGIRNSLIVKLNQVTALLASGDATDARAVLDADFVGEVDDLHDDGELTDAQAAELVASAALIGSTIQQSNS